VSASVANPATLFPLLLHMVEQANQSPSTRNKRGGLCSSHDSLGAGRKAAIRVDCRQDADENFGPTGVSRNESRFVLGHCFGPFQRPAARRSSASAAPPFGLRFPPSVDPP
jgi:hypothetical protein